MATTALATAIELREHWQVFKRSIRLHRPLAHEWMWITGDRIKTTGTMLRRHLGYDNPYNLGGTAEVEDLSVFLHEGKRCARFVECATEERALNVRDNLNELCPSILMAAGTVGYGGKRSMGSRLPHVRKREILSIASLDRLLESLSPSGLERPKPRQKPYKGPRAIAYGLIVYARHKGHAVPYMNCVTNLGAETIAARTNRRNGWPDELPVLTPTGTFKRRNCPYCGKNVTSSWLGRHVVRYHSDENTNGVSQRELFL